MQEDNSLIDSYEEGMDVASEGEEEREFDDSPDPLLIKKEQEQKREDARKFFEEQNKRGVCFLSSIPQYMTVVGIKNYFKKFHVERVYLKPEGNILLLPS